MSTSLLTWIPPNSPGLRTNAVNRSERCKYPETPSNARPLPRLLVATFRLNALRLNTRRLRMRLAGRVHLNGCKVEERIVERRRIVGHEIVALRPRIRTPVAEDLSSPLPTQRDVDNQLLRLERFREVAALTAELRQWLLLPRLRVGFSGRKVSWEVVAWEQPHGHAIGGPFMDVDAAALFVELGPSGCHRLSVDGILFGGLDGAADCAWTVFGAGTAVSLLERAQHGAGVVVDCAAG